MTNKLQAGECVGKENDPHRSIKSPHIAIYHRVQQYSTQYFRVLTKEDKPYPWPYYPITYKYV